MCFLVPAEKKKILVLAFKLENETLCLSFVVLKTPTVEKIKNTVIRLGREVREKEGKSIYTPLCT